MTNQELINNFYTSFSKGDFQGMIDCYHDNVEFEDPAFGKLYGDKAKAMWQMLITKNKGGIIITYNNVESNDKIGSANWIAKYTFSQTGRPVTNIVSANFEFKDGKIIKHTDKFNLWSWTLQALGFKGYLLGWTPFMKTKLQQSTTKLLSDFINKQAVN